MVGFEAKTSESGMIARLGDELGLGTVVGVAEAGGNEGVGSDVGETVGSGVGDGRLAVGALETSVL